MADKCPPITNLDLIRAAKSVEETRRRRKDYLERIDSNELVHQIEDIIGHLDHSKIIRNHVGPEQADFMVDRARQLLIELLGVHLEDGL